MNDFPAADGVVTVADCRLRVLPGAEWSFARERGVEIHAHWQRRTRENPALFNGVVHLCCGYRLDELSFEADYVRTDFASYLYWREQPRPDPGVRNSFGSALVRASDGPLLLGRAGAASINAGLVNPPGGFIDERDVDAGGRIDIDASIARELVEETGLGASDLVRAPGYTLVFDGLLISIGVSYLARTSAADLAQRVEAFIARDREPELAGVVLVASREAIGGYRTLGYTKRLVAALYPGRS
jgi:8-oxo-dGTP pyrophosphatase MutT (NUDIX family)